MSSNTMDEFLIRQLALIQRSVTDYRSGLLGLNGLVQRLEAIGNVIGGRLWEEQLFEIVVDIERINSEIIDKNRQMTSDEKTCVENILQQVELIVTGL